VEEATVLLAGAEVPCCAAAVRSRDDERTIRESCIVRITIGQRMGSKEKKCDEALPDLLYPKQQICICTAIFILLPTLLPTCVAKPLAGVD
jgi:hypothetical protein